MSGTNFADSAGSPGGDGAAEPDQGRRRRPPPQLVRGLAAAAVAFVLYHVLQLLWPTPSGVVVQGVIVGSLTALISFGITLTYRANRVINFAQADLGAVPATLAITLYTMTRAVPGATGPSGSGATPGTLVRQPAGWPYPVCMAIGLVAAIALGMVVERVFIRRFSKAPRLILMVVTIGLAQILTGVATVLPALLQGGGLSSIATTTKPFPSPFDFSFEISPVVFGGNDIIAVVVTTIAIGALFLFLRYTSIGIAIRASAESSDRASLLGVNVGVTQNVAWVAATVLSTVALLLRGGIFGLPLGSAFGPTILLRALAAAVIGRMENFGVIFLAACGLGIIETAVIWNESSATLVDPALFVVVIGALLLQRRRRESRVEDQSTSTWQDGSVVRPIPRELAGLPEVRWGLRGMYALVAVAAVVLPLLLDDGDTNLASAVFIYAVIGLSLVILTGWAGEISLGHMAFVAIGSAVAGALNVHYGWDLSLTLLAAGGVGALASLVIGLPALRIRGLFLAVSTMAFALATSSYLLNERYFGYLPDSLSEQVLRLPLLGRLDVAGETPFYYVCLAVLVVVLWSVSGIRRWRIGRVLVATRENPRTAQAFGIGVTRTKITAFALAGFFASMAGGLFAVHQRAIGQEVFAPAESVRVLTMVVVGGLGSVPGAVLGAVFIKSTEWFNALVPLSYRPLFTFAGSGMGLLFVLWFLPGGLGGLLYRGRDVLLRKVALRRGIVVPSLVTDKPAEQDAFADISLIGESTNLLSVRSLDVNYGPVQVLFGVNVELEQGEVVALLGTNGAGKSTVLRAVSGLVAPVNGSVWFDGNDISGLPPHRIAALGLVQVPGGKGVFPSLSVAENLRVAGWLFRRDAAYLREATEEVLDLFPVLRRRLAAPAATLSGGEQQMLTLAMAFIAKPKLLLIDELSLGLAPVVVEELLKVVRGFVERGTTVVLVEQSVNVALTFAHTAYFMEKGEVRFRGPTRDLLERPDVLRSVFLEGAAVAPTSDEQPRRARTRRPAEPMSAPAVLETNGLVKRFSGVTAVAGVSISLREGEILGIIGPNGAGKTTFFDLVSGFLVPDDGTITFNGRDITSTGPAARSQLGLARSFQDARLFGSLTVHQVICVALDRRLEVRDPVAAALNLPAIVRAEARLARQADELVALMNLEGYRDKFVSELSTGSRRIVDLACQIGLEPKVILFDEPSSGIAQREAEALAPLLLRIRDETGAGLLVIEHDMPLITAISDRLVALDLGAVVADGDHAEVMNDPRVVASYLGSTREVIERSGTALVEAS